MSNPNLPIPYSRRELYLNAIAEGSTNNIPENPISRIEMYLDYIARHGQGGSSTGDYEDLLNLPKINGVTLKGNKVPAQLGFSTVCSMSAATETTVAGYLEFLDATLLGETDFTQLFKISNRNNIVGADDEVILPAGSVLLAEAFFNSSDDSFTFSGVVFNKTSGSLLKASFNYSGVDGNISDLVVSDMLDILPPAPSEDGTYTLKCTVSSGSATYSWVADE